MNPRFVTEDGSILAPVGAGATYQVAISPHHRATDGGTPIRLLHIIDGNLFTDTPETLTFVLPADRLEALATSTIEHDNVQVVGASGARLTCIVNHRDRCYLPEALVLNVERHPERYPGEMLTLVHNRGYLKPVAK